jgi:RNA polymerase primary sigma factor
MKSNDSVRIFLKEMGRFKQLTHEQEIELANKVQKKNRILIMLEEKNCSNITKKKCRQFFSGSLKEKNLSVFLKHVLKQISSDLDYSSNSSLLKVYQSGQKACKTMVSCNLRLVVSIAKKYLNRGIPFVDLIQEGAIGLQKAVEKFDPKRGFRFSTAAYWWVRQEITRAIQNQSRLIRLPIHFCLQLNKIKRAQTELSQELLRTPTSAEVAQRLNMKVEEYKKILQHPRCNLSLNSTGVNKEDPELLLLIPSEDKTSLQKLEEEALKSELNFLLRFLTPEEKDILTLRYGLNGANPTSSVMIGRYYDLSKERVEMILKKALTKAKRAASII